jgi:hypothetical protein
MSRSRSDDLLEAWKMVAQHAQRPVEAPRPRTHRGAGAVGLIAAGGVAVVLVVALAIRGGGPGPQPSQPAVGASPSAGASASPPPPTENAIPLRIANGSTIIVQLVVNGQVVATVAPGTEVAVPTSTLGPRPWAIETRSPSGRVLSAMNVAADADYNINSGPGVRADLSCGQIDVWLGPGMLGPVTSPSVDCGSLTAPSSQPSPTGPISFNSAAAVVDQYENDLVRTDYADAWQLLAPDSPARAGQSIAAWSQERQQFFQSAGDQYTVRAPQADTAPLADWLAAPWDASIDRAQAVLIEVDYPALAGNNAGWELYIVNPTPTGLEIYDVR